MKISAIVAVKMVILRSKIARMLVKYSLPTAATHTERCCSNGCTVEEKTFHYLGCLS